MIYNRNRRKLQLAIQQFQFQPNSHYKTHPSIYLPNPYSPIPSFQQHLPTSTMSTYRKKIFPLRLPNNFHGQAPQKPLHQQYKQRVQSCKQPNPQLPNTKIVNWQLKRKNNDVINQRRQFLVHTGKISNDTPFWFQTTSDFYRRHQAGKLRVRQSPKQEKNFDVFNRRRASLHEWRSSTQPIDQRLFEKRNSMMEKSCAWNVTGKVGDVSSQPRSSSINFFSNKSQVTGKVGAVETRDYSVRKPQMKVGKSGFIDTYSPF